MGLVIDGHYRQKTYYSSPTCTLRVFLNFFEFKRFPFSLLLYYIILLSITDHSRVSTSAGRDVRAPAAYGTITHHNPTRYSV